MIYQLKPGPPLPRLQRSHSSCSVSLLKIIGYKYSNPVFPHVQACGVSARNRGSIGSQAPSVPKHTPIRFVRSGLLSQNTRQSDVNRRLRIRRRCTHPSPCPEFVFGWMWTCLFRSSRSRKCHSPARPRIPRRRRTRRRWRTKRPRTGTGGLCTSVRRTRGGEYVHMHGACEGTREGERSSGGHICSSGPRTLIVGVSTPPEPACGVVPHSARWIFI